MQQFVPMTDEMWWQSMARGEQPVPYRPGLACVHHLRDAYTPLLTDVPEPPLPDRC